jgi:hypothetical protein
VHGIAVAGATFPAQIWHDFMTTAHGTNCDSFPPPTVLPKFSTFYGAHAANGTKIGSQYSDGTGTSTTPSTGGTTTPSTGGTGGNGGTGGYDPNLYASPPQGPPHTTPPSPTPTPTQGNGNGNGNNGGNGNGNPR